MIGFQSEGVPPQSGDESFLFQPAGVPNKSALIFLPGGMVDPAAYAPLMTSIAQAGHQGYIQKLPWRCSCTDSQINELFQQIETTIKAAPNKEWFLAGHSRGAMLTSRFAHDFPGMLKGIVLIGTTHPRDFDLSTSTLRVTKIYGTRDGIAPEAATRKNASLLPPATSWVPIEGGNHVQFGYYRHQLGDNNATISRQQQQDLLKKAMLKALE